MTKSMLAGMLLSATIGGTVAWRVVDRPEAKRTDGVIVCDNSQSVVDTTSSCVGLVAEALSRPHLAKGATLQILTLGDAKDGNEPIRVATYTVPYSRRALEGKKALAQRRQQLLDDLKDRVRQLPRTATSPIFLAAKRALEQVVSTCRPSDECFVSIRSDLLETAEPLIRQALKTTRPIKQLPRLPNDGVQVNVCGLAEADGTIESKQPLHDVRHSDRVVEVWRSTFSAPALVRFEPYCPLPRFD